MGSARNTLAPVLRAKELSMSSLKSDSQLSALSLSETGGFDYLLIDGVKIEPVLKWVYQQIDNPEWYPLYKDT